MPTPDTAARTCDGCALCCKLGEIPDFKPFNQWCQFCSSHRHCDIYDARPQPCRDFYCHYLLSDLGEEWRPTHCGMVVSAYSNPVRMTVSVDPAQPQRWRDAPYYAQLLHWSQQGSVTVMVGEHAYAVYPEGMADLGILALDETIEITEQQSANGLRYRARRVPKTPAP